MAIERWLAIPGYEGFYAISDHGRIKRTSDASLGAVKAGRILKPRPLPSGYHRVNLCRDSTIRGFLIHRLVLITFVSEPPFPDAQCNHKNGIKTDNRLENLEWVTQGQNVQHSYDMLGHKAQGETHHASHLTVENVLEIRRLAASGMKHKDIAPLFGLTRRGIGRIVTRDSWKHV